MPQMLKMDIQRSIFDERLKVVEDRKFLREMLLDFYDENQFCKDDYFKSWGFQDKKALPFLSTRFVKSVIDRRSMVFKEPVKRGLVNESGDPIENDGIRKFFADHPRFTIRFRMLERYRNLLDNVVLRIAYDMDRQRYIPYIEKEYVPEFGTHDNQFPIGYHFPMRFDDRSTETDVVWLYVSDQEYYFHYEDGRERFADPNYPDMVNPYGKMPVIDYSRDNGLDYWGMGAKGLVEHTRSYLIALLSTLYAHHFQAYDQPWMSTDNYSNLPKDKQGNPFIQVGSDRFITLGGDGQAGLLGFNPKLVESMEMLKQMIGFEISNWGMKAAFREAGNPMSGFALLVDNFALLEQRESDLEELRPLESELFAVIKAMNEVHGRIYNIPENSLMVSDFVEPTFPESQAEEQSRWNWAWQNNLATREDYLLDKNPELTPEQAQQIVDDNSIKNRQGRGLFTQQQQGNINGA